MISLINDMIDAIDHDLMIEYQKALQLEGSWSNSDW